MIAKTRYALIIPWTNFRLVYAIPMILAQLLLKIGGQNSCELSLLKIGPEEIGTQTYSDFWFTSLDL